MDAKLRGRRWRFTEASEAEKGPFATPASTRETLSNSLLTKSIPPRILRRGFWERGEYRGTSLPRKRHPVGPYSRTIPEVIGESLGDGCCLMGEVARYRSSVSSIIASASDQTPQIFEKNQRPSCLSREFLHIAILVGLDAESQGCGRTYLDSTRCQTL